MTSRIQEIARDGKKEILRLETKPFGTNAYMVICPGTLESVLIDAPGSAETIKERLKDTKVKYILMTHGHMDHITDLEELHRDLSATLAVHEKDAGQLPIKADRFLSGGEKIQCGNLELEVIHAPGHTPGSLCFRIDSYLISGDTIFPGGPGKTASPDAFKQIMASIEEIIMNLPDDTVILPGHGDKTNLKIERELFNTFKNSRQDFELSGDVTWLGT